MKRLLLVTFLFGFAQTYNVHATIFHFSQGGFDDDFTMSGSLNGFFASTDGWIRESLKGRRMRRIISQNSFNFPHGNDSFNNHIFSIFRMNYDLDGIIGNDPSESLYVYSPHLNF